MPSTARRCAAPGSPRAARPTCWPPWTTTGAVLAQRQVDGAPEEVTGFQPLLADLDLAGSGWRGRGVVQPSVCLANRTVCSMV
jgi:hypothetical protein